MTRARRVAFVIHSFDRGGSGRVVAHLAHGFAAAGLEVTILAFCRGGAAEAQAEAIAGPDVAIDYFARDLGRRPLDLAAGLPRLVGRLRRDPPDVVIGAANNVAVVTAAAVRLAGMGATRCYLKTTNPVAGSRHRGIGRRVRDRSYRAAFRRADGVWTLSPDEADEMRAAFPRFADLFTPVVNPYVTPEMLAEPAHAAATLAGGQVVAVARLDPQKRLERLLAAFARVRHPDARLLILGEGQERPALEALVDTLGLRDRVSMPGHVEGVAAALHASDLLVMTSDYEGLPAAVLEAMAANCPVLSTPCFPAARTLLVGAEGCGIIEDLSPDALAARIDERLARPRPTRLRAVAERFSIQNGVASHLAALDT